MFLLCYHSLRNFTDNWNFGLGAIIIANMAFWWVLMKCVVTFRADISAGDAHLDPVLLHLHLVAGTGSDTGAVVHHKVIYNPTHKARINGQTAACPWTNSKQSLWKRPLTFCNGREETSILRQKPLTHPRERTGDPDCGVCAWKEAISGSNCAAWHPSPEKRKGSRRAR